MPVMYAHFYGILIDIARAHGYALAVHGSFTRDMDLIAIPWIEKASAPLTVVIEMGEAIGRKAMKAHFDIKEEPIKKPHGRIVYTIPTGAGGYVDIGFMHRHRKNKKESD
jgi:hypothetical protein